MTDRDKANLSRHTSTKLAAILFADIAGYTALMQEDEEGALLRLNRFEELLEKYAPEYGGQIVQYFGDGCVMAFGVSKDAVSCAMRLQRVFGEDPTIPVRMGLHLGDVVFKSGNVYGDGVNIASRIESLGIPGSVLMSKAIRDQIRNKAEFQLEALGWFDFKNVKESMQVFALANPGLIVPDKKNLARMLRRHPSGGWKSQPLYVRVILLSLLAIIAVLLYRNSIVKGNRSQQEPDMRTNAFSWSVSDVDAVENSIAVLPFTNMSADPANEPFTLGIHDDVISQISRISGLKVISRTSVLKYRGAEKNVPEIARELGVAHILEGAVQRAGDRVRINVQLIDARRDNHLWAETYERSLSAENIFDIQREITESIGNQLKIEFTPRERQSLLEVPTSQLDAYDYFVLGRDLVSKLALFNFAVEVLDQAISNFEKAIALDTQYDEALAGLGEALALKGYFVEEARASTYSRAMQVTERALELNPNSSLAHTAKAYILRTWQWDWAASEQEFRRALELNPNSSVTRNYYALLLTALNRKEEAIDQINQAFKLDPRSERIKESIYRIHRFLREFEISRQIYLQSPEDEHVLAWNEREQNLNWETGYFLYTGAYDSVYHRMMDEIRTDTFFTISQVRQLEQAYRSQGITEFFGLKSAFHQQIGQPDLLSLIWGIDDDLAIEVIRREMDVRQGYIVYIQVEPFYDPLRSDPRFQAMLEEMNFPD